MRYVLWDTLAAGENLKFWFPSYHRPLEQELVVEPYLKERYDQIGYGNDFRILNDAGRPYLYPPHLFEVFDPSEPGDWVTDFGDDGERYAYPAP